jgi:sugar lactone lactonase YvrE
MVTLILCACSEPDWLNEENTRKQIVQMGGAIQGNPLKLTTAVSTMEGLAGVSGITTDGTNLYITDTVNNTIQQIVISTGAVTTLAGAALFNSPQGITTDGTNLYVADTDNNTIRQIVISTGAVTTLAGTAGSSGSADGVGAAALFNAPQGITTDGTYLYVTDSANNTIRRISIYTGIAPQFTGQVAGKVITLAGTAGSSGSADGIGTAALFYSPQGITMDGTNLYVADTGNHTIRVIAISTGVVVTLVGTAGSSGSADGVGAAARFNSPQGITTDGANLFVADTGNNTIRQITISSTEVVTVTTLAGTAGSSGSADGTGSAARFSSPEGITTDGTYLYVTDTANNTIRKIQ